MAIYQLPPESLFPPPDRAEPDGLLAVGGDLSPKRLLVAYRLGIFPWYSTGEPICWWSPDPRFTLLPHELHVSQRLRRVIRSKRYTVRYDTMFDAVIERCATTLRPGQDGTWITPAMRDAYSKLHRLGIAHSIESWSEGKLVGGVYGIALGGTFFGESMFTHQSDASKVALVALVWQLQTWSFDLVDCQVPTQHLARFGAKGLPRSEFLKRLQNSVNRPNLWGGAQQREG
ncbi:MAG: leucyl/phenylalanyl-tRNA--protein transferase [Nitrospiraceae bacterium]|nr:leucyl/phenylalanyl-tRNA--protein transferase [Nitrospiraceae bacterium]|tara:strand:+ start:1405 stop:2094 length:690 start_codon:yes stop_codon:yes gene_type:complete